MYVAGFGFKGEGKGANYGLPIPAPSIVPVADLLQVPLPSNSAADQVVSDVAPAPIPVTLDEIDEWMSTGFQPLSQISKKMPPEVGESVLWR